MKQICLKGTVVHGQQLGRKLGYPTANLGVEGLEGSLPDAGVYVGDCTLPSGQVLRSMINIGYRPTVDPQSHRLSVEAHLLDFDGDLYGQTLQLNILDYIRAERKMASLDDLRHQLALDLMSCKNYQENSKKGK